MATVFSTADRDVNCAFVVGYEPDIGGPSMDQSRSNRQPPAAQLHCWHLRLRLRGNQLIYLGYLIADDVGTAVDDHLRGKWPVLSKGLLVDLLPLGEFRFAKMSFQPSRSQYVTP